MDETPSVEQEKSVQVLLDLLKLGSHLDYQEAKGGDREQSISNWNELNRLKKEQRFDYVIKAYLPLWLCVRNPFWTVLFLTIRAQVVVGKNEVAPDGLELLERLLNLAEFSKPLSLETSYLVRRAIATKKVSRWHALSLLKSNACSVSASGRIELHGASRTAVTFGVIIATLFVICIVVIAAVVIAELDRDCMRHCIWITGVQLITLLAGFTHLTRLLTWERNRKQRFIAQVF